MNITKEEALTLLKEYNKEEFHLKHADTVNFVMEYFAKQLGYEDEAEFWGLVGLLHDLDFEMYPEEHCVKVQEILKEKGIDEKMINAIASHGYGLTKATQKPEHEMEKVLFAVDELTGLIGAVALMRPSKSVSDLEVKSLKKKFKTPSFAAGCSREAIQQGADMLGWELDDLFQKTILAMREYENSTNKK
ncbi:hydrolase [Sedimentibacter sp.]|uniref:hydrolase n=1 Tax=Sedimentibacter sp. TaxID=1960295 RepID=UPI0028AFEA28|nr:hydrolase [Sedimentibacter sp.]